MLTFLLLIITTLQNPEEIVQKQLDTYNARDIEGFMSVMSQDVTLINHADQKIIAEGIEEVHGIYTNLFQKSPKLHSQLTNRIVMGNKVIDHESITGRMGSDEVIELVVIYEVAKDKIFKITVLRP